jgi:hypothetical protein
MPDAGGRRAGALHTPLWFLKFCAAQTAATGVQELRTQRPFRCIATVHVLIQVLLWDAIAMHRLHSAGAGAVAVDRGLASMQEEERRLLSSVDCLMQCPCTLQLCAQNPPLITQFKHKWYAKLCHGGEQSHWQAQAAIWAEVTATRLLNEKTCIS